MKEEIKIIQASPGVTRSRKIYGTDGHDTERAKTSVSRLWKEKRERNGRNGLLDASVTGSSKIFKKKFRNAVEVETSVNLCRCCNGVKINKHLSSLFVHELWCFSCLGS